jgi:hypothetical protein
MHERARILRELGSEKNRLFRERQVGRTLSVLTLDERTEYGTVALTGNYLKVALRGEPLPANQIIAVEIVSLAGGMLVGENHGGRDNLSGDKLEQPQAAPQSPEGQPIESPSMITCARA